MMRLHYRNQHLQRHALPHQRFKLSEQLHFQHDGAINHHRAKITSRLGQNIRDIAISKIDDNSTRR